MPEVTIQESVIELTHGRKGKIAVLMYIGAEDPVVELDSAVSAYVGHSNHAQFIDINMDNPWVRVIIYGMNEIKQEDFDPLRHKLQP